jgi:hypothetical protein
MKKALMTFAIVFSIALAGSAYAQTPNIQIYFDANMTMAAENCPDAPLGSVIDTLYVVGNNFDMWLSAVEFQIIYPPQLTYLSDQYDTPTFIGRSDQGLTLAWPLPKNAFGPVVLMTATVAWFCNVCYDGASIDNRNAPLDVVPNPNQGHLRAVRWPDNALFDLVGMRSLICATTPVEETSWGQIKAMYN